MSTLRHVGVKVKTLDGTVAEWKAMGWDLLGDIETVTIQKMHDKAGNVMEFFESDGGYDPHVAINWFRDRDGNLWEIVEGGK